MLEFAATALSRCRRRFVLFGKVGGREGRCADQNMNEALCLKTLADVMVWDNDRAREEYQWLRLISRFKYDDYRDFVAGVRFLELPPEASG